MITVSSAGAFVTSERQPKPKLANRTVRRFSYTLCRNHSQVSVSWCMSCLLAAFHSLRVLQRSMSSVSFQFMKVNAWFYSDMHSNTSGFPRLLTAVF